MNQGLKFLSALSSKSMLLAMLNSLCLIIFSSCGFKASSKGANLFERTQYIISGVVTPLLGSIAAKPSSNFLVNSSYAALCTTPVYAHLYKLKNDGTTDDSQILLSELVGPDAVYSFDLTAAKLSPATSTTVEYVVKVNGCNNEVYKRPVTDFDNKQDIDAKTTVVSEVINTNQLSKNLNEVEKKDVELLIKSISGSSTNDALNSLTSDSTATTKFSQIFGSSPSLILDAKPEVILNYPSTSINELSVSQLSASAFHVDPNYSFAYRWKLDGVVKSSASSWSYIPSANDSGLHQIDLYVGKDDGAGNIDLTKPYYTKQLRITVNNNILPVAPAININATTPTPVNTNSIKIDMATGVSLANCQSFSHLAFTDTPSVPGIMQFNIACSSSGTQTQTVTFSNTDGAKTLYLWAIDSEGVISSAKTISLTLDTLPPQAQINAVTSLVKGGSAYTITFSATDAGVGLATLDLYYSDNAGSTYTLISHLGTQDTSYAWSIPSLNTSNAKLKLVATDGTGSSTIAYSNLFEIDSLAPTAPTITRNSAAISLSRDLSINVVCASDYSKISFSESNIPPSENASSWENCASTKSFNVSSGDGLKTIFAFTKDAVGNISSSSNVSMTLDTTPPAAPLATLSSAQMSSSESLNFTIADCSDRANVLISESLIAPSPSDSHWQSCSTAAGGLTYTLNLPAVQGLHYLYVYAKDAVGNVSLATPLSMVFDSVAPNATLSTSLAALYKGGDQIVLNFAASDENNLSSLKLEYTSDGTNYVTIANLSTASTSYSWTVPAINTSSAQIRLIATDTATTANSKSVSTSVFAIDSTRPLAPTLARTTPAISASTTVSMTLGSCLDTTYILITESNTPPTASSSGWQICSTNSGAINATVTGEGPHTLYAWAQDLAGNIASSAQSISMTLDKTAPVIAVTNPNSMQGNTNSGIVSWNLSELNVASGSIFTIEIFNGTSWQALSTLSANAGANANTNYTLSNFAVPNNSTNMAAIRVSFTDAAGNSSSATSNPFLIDSNAPILSSVIINDGATYAGTTMVNVKVNVADDFSAGSQIQVRLAAAHTITEDCQSEFSNTNWILWSSSTTNIPFSLVPTDGVKKICVWAKDALGNISVMNPTTGSAGINTDSIIYSVGNPPQLSSFTAYKTNTGGTIAAAGDFLTLSWTATDIEGLDNNPISFAYTTDNVTWKDITTNLTIATSSNTTWGGNLSNNPMAATGSVTTWTAPTNSYFRIRAQVRDMAGNTSLVAMSQPFNTGSWSVYAGTKDRGDGGTGRAAALTGGGFFSHFAINPKNGDIYAVDLSKGIRKLDAKTGLVSTFIKHGANNLPTNGPLLSSSTLSVDAYVNPIFDNSGRLYLAQSSSNGYPTALIYQFDLENSSVRLYAGGGLLSDGGSASTALQIPAGGYTFDEQNSLYVWTHCGGVATTTTNYTSVSKRIVKIAQNSDGTPGTTTRVIGDCTTAAFTSGAQAYSQPAMSGSTYNLYSGIIAWDNGNKILVIPYSTGALRYKIINGVIYSTNISAAPTLGLGIYNPVDGYVYRSNSSGVEKVLINTSGANGDTATQYFTSNSSATGCTADGVSTTSYCGVILTQYQVRSGLVYFADGAGANAGSNYSIRYFDSNNQLRTVFGSQPFYGDGLDKSIMRGTISGIYYKKSTESNQSAFPEGLYFMESAGLVFGRINPSDNLVTNLWGNQSRIATTPINGTTISKNLTMGNAYVSNGQPLVFDSNGLPWFRINSDVVSVDSNNKIVRRTNQSSSALLQLAPNGANPANYGLSVYTGAQNFALKNNGLFVQPNYINIGYDPIISIRYMDFTNLVTPIVIGGNYLASSNTAASADIPTAGGVASAPLWTSCRNGAYCYMRYNAASDRLYYAEGSKMRYITTPDNTATSTLGTLFTLSSGSVYNFSFTPDNSQLWYFRSTGGLYCYDISSGKSWCDNTTDHFSIRTAAGLSVSPGADQMTFKDNQTLFVSTYQGEILQFNLPTTP